MGQRGPKPGAQNAGRPQGSRAKFPTGSDIKAAFASDAWECRDKLLDLLHCGISKTELLAAKEILDRGLGRPSAQADTEDDKNKTVPIIVDARQLTHEELHGILDNKRDARQSCE